MAQREASPASTQAVPLPKAATSATAKLARPNPGPGASAQLHQPSGKAAPEGGEKPAEAARAESAIAKRRGFKEGGAPAEANLAAAQLAAVQAASLKPLSPKAAAPAEASSLEAADKAKRPASAAPRLEVSDLRKARQKKEGPSELVEASKAPAVEEKGRVRELRLELGQPDSSAKAGTQDSGAAEKPLASGSDFSSLLADKLRESWNGEIVKSAHIILRDGDMGTIRLRLRPESLGSVKIELNLAENNISGKIVVESDEAKSAFERSMAELQDAFREGGFDSAKLEVSVGSDGAQARGESGGGEAAAGPFWSERHRGAAFEEAVPRVLPTLQRAERALDILA